MAYRLDVVLSPSRGILSQRVHANVDIGAARILVPEPRLEFGAARLLC